MICTECDKPIHAGYSIIDGDPTCAECLTRRTSRTTKYGNQRTEYNGRTFDSKVEADRAAELEVIKGGSLIEYGCQPRFKLGECGIVYIADFIVTELATGLSHVEDVKGVETPRFRIVRQMWKRYGKHPLVVLKRAAGGWTRDVIWPIGVDRFQYAQDWLGEL